MCFHKKKKGALWKYITVTRCTADTMLVESESVLFTLPGIDRKKYIPFVRVAAFLATYCM